jgi:glycerol-3-phosphate dehydrogenase
LIRDLLRLTSREFDVLVVGGGIYGLTIAYDAAQRGLGVALVERKDFGSATSFNHLKTIHGGLRYLKTVDLARVRESIQERRAFARIAPRFITPLAFAMPLGASITRNPLAMQAAFILDSLIGRDRNQQVDVTRHLPAGRIVRGRECDALFDGAIPAVGSAAVWHDYLTTDGDRLTLSFAKAAAKYDAVVANYTEALGPLRSPAKARDTLTGQTFDIRARVVVNAAGPWAAALLDHPRVRTRWRLLKAMNLVTSRPAGRAAVVGTTRGGRALVLLPWQGRMLVGTGESPDERRPDDQDAQRAEVDRFLVEVRQTFPALGLKTDEVTLVHRGVVPASRRNGRLSLLGHSRIFDHSDAGSPELISVVGVKYTTARAVAERVVDLILRKLHRAPIPCLTAQTVLPDASLDDRDPSDPVIHAIREEMAQTLTDVVIRRTGLGAAGYPGDAAARDVAARMQSECAWSDERTSAELESLKRFYDIK